MRIAERRWSKLWEVTKNSKPEQQNSQSGKKVTSCDRDLEPRTENWLLLLFLRQLHFRRIEFLLHFGLRVRVDFGRNCFAPFFEGALPVRGSELQASGLLIEISEVLLHCGVGTHVRGRFGQTFFGKIVLAQPVVSPSQGVEIRSVVGIDA